MSEVIATDLNKSENPAFMIFGIVYCILMATCGFLLVYEPFKTKTSTGLSKDFLLMHFTGMLLLNVNDVYGFFGNSSYKNEIHISDITLSFLFTLFMVVGLIEVHVIPCDSINKFSIPVTSICTLSI